MVTQGYDNFAFVPPARRAGQAHAGGSQQRCRTPVCGLAVLHILRLDSVFAIYDSVDAAVADVAGT